MISWFKNEVLREIASRIGTTSARFNTIPVFLRSKSLPRGLIFLN
jgi:hypothetical protein